MIGVINYGLGNIRAFLNVYERLRMPACAVSGVSELKKVTHLILPGVGSFDHAMGLLNSSGMRDELEKLVLINKVPILGVCLGMQIMSNSSAEGKSTGLGWFNGSVKLFDNKSIKFKTHYPHMGWNSIAVEKTDPLLSDISSKSRFYFLHSYYFECDDSKDVLCTTSYGNKFTSGISKGVIWGMQFHPEKSHDGGVTLLKNFARINNP